jgi:folate-binding protein YgfZ
VVLIPLSHLGLIRATGADVTGFLHSLLTSDVRKLAPGKAQYSGLCTAKGRLLASFLVWRSADDLLLHVSRDIKESILKKLSMYILRSKVKLTDADPENVLIGLAGARAAEALAGNGLPVPAAMETIDFAGGSVIGLDANRWQLCVAAEQAAALWDALALAARPAGENVWRLLDIRAGLPLVSLATQDELVPQMANFELIGAVSFQKGCFPGQEVVARAQYLGKLKRRMYLAHCEDSVRPAPGTHLYSPEFPDQSCGVVVDSAATVRGGFDLLAVMQTASAASEQVHLGRPDGPNLTFESLPYTVD